MRVLILGASGAIGAQVRALVRAAGHEAVLFGRDPERLQPLAASETLVLGDIADAASVARAVTGVEAAISALGPTSNTPDQPALFENFARTLVGAMGAHRVRRLIAVSGAACAIAGERKRLSARIASAIVRMTVRHVVEAKQRELDVIAASDLDWVAPRPPRVTASPPTGRYRAGEAATGMRISQGDLAAFMVAQLTDDTYLRQAPLVSN